MTGMAAYGVPRFVPVHLTSLVDPLERTAVFPRPSDAGGVGTIGVLSGKERLNMHGMCIDNDYAA